MRFFHFDRDHRRAIRSHKSFASVSISNYTVDLFRPYSHLWPVKVRLGFCSYKRISKLMLCNWFNYVQREWMGCVASRPRRTKESSSSTSETPSNSTDSEKCRDSLSLITIHRNFAHFKYVRFYRFMCSRNKSESKFHQLLSKT